MNNKLVPRLRFKQFNEQWKHTQINKLLKIKNGRSQKKVETTNGAYPILATSGQIGRTNNYLYNGESVLIGRKGTINKPMYFKGRFWTVDTLFYSHLFNNSDGKFIFNLFKTVNWLRYNTSSGIPSLTSKNIESININVPTLSEQKQIGSFFAKLDHMIKLQSKKLEHLKKLKKGYLQKMFPQKGENIPRLRFNGFHNEWDKKKLKDISNSVGGTALEKYFHSNGQYKVISIGSYGLDNEYIDQGIRAIANKKVNSKIVNKGNLTMVLNDKTKGRILGKTLLITENNKYVINQRSEIIKPNSNINSLFLYFQINAPYFHRALLSVAQGGTQIYVNYNSISKLTLSIPNIQEQNKIGQFFKNIDCSINQQDNKLTQIKELKKAYLQKMFI